MFCIFLLDKKYYGNLINLVMVCGGGVVFCREVFLYFIIYFLKELCLYVIFVDYNNENKVRMVFC